MEKIKRNKTLILCIGEMIIGVLLFVEPEAFTAGIIIAIGVALMLFGVLEIISYFKMEAVEAAAK